MFGRPTVPRPDSSFNDQHVTNNQRLDRAVYCYWQTRFPGRPGRVLIVDRTVESARKAAA